MGDKNCLVNYYNGQLSPLSKARKENQAMFIWWAPNRKEKYKLAFSMLRLLSSEAQESKDFLKNL